MFSQLYYTFPWNCYATQKVIEVDVNEDGGKQIETAKLRFYDRVLMRFFEDPEKDWRQKQEKSDQLTLF